MVFSSRAQAVWRDMVVTVIATDTATGDSFNGLGAVVCCRANRSVCPDNMFPRLGARRSRVVRVMAVFSEAWQSLMSGACRLMGTALDMSQCNLR